jgi:hypothetical protein
MSPADGTTVLNIYALLSANANRALSYALRRVERLRRTAIRSPDTSHPPSSWVDGLKGLPHMAHRGKTYTRLPGDAMKVVDGGRLFPFSLPHLTGASLLAIALTSGSAYGQTSGRDRSCAEIARLKLPQSTISSAQAIDAGTSPSLPDSAGHDAGVYSHLPAFCRVIAVLSPSTDSKITVEIWMPMKQWNRRLRGQGNGGFGGEIDYPSMAEAIAQGYATVGTDTGHAGSAIDASWSLGHPEKIIDFGFRSIHLMTTAAKDILRAFYGNLPLHSYFASCSNGGREALMEAERFPEDYDGIVAGAPAYDWTHLMTHAIYNMKLLTSDASSYLPASKLPVITTAVAKSCETIDGVVSHPESCHVPTHTLMCQGSETENCLTPGQAEVLEKLYRGSQNSAGKPIFPGYLPGAELGPGGWTAWITGTQPGRSLTFAFGYGYFANMVYGDRNWDYKGASIDEDLQLAASRTGAAMDATDLDVRPFVRKGGKLILYQGWSDPAISPLNAIALYNGIANAVGKRDAESSVELFMVPGLQHCSGGPAPDNFGQNPSAAALIPADSLHDINLAVESWVEKRAKPKQLIAVKLEGANGNLKTVQTQPLCPYPAAARYTGSGDKMTASSYLCTARP